MWECACVRDGFVAWPGARSPSARETRIHLSIPIAMPDLLLFSDIHGDMDACRSLVRRSAEVDVVVGAGDFCNMRRGLQRVIDVLAEI